MGKKTLFFFSAMFATSVLSFEVSLNSGIIPLPKADGSFSDIKTIGYSVHHAYFILTDAQYSKYASSSSSSRDIFNDYLGGTNGWTPIADYPNVIRGSSELDLSYIISDDDWWGYDTNANIACIYVYINENGITNYIARAVSKKTPTEREDDYSISEYASEIVVNFSDIAINAGRWEVVAPPSIDLTCTSFAVTGGNVTASYEISDFPWLEANMVNDNGSNTISVIAASDLARTNTTNILANVTATDSATSTFSVTFPAPDATAYPSLFLFGLEKP